MGLFERLMNSFKEKNKEVSGKEGEEGEVGGVKQVDEAEVKELLKGIVYEDEMVEELLPFFVDLYLQEGFSKVVELLEAKEQQICTISGSEWFKQETGGNEEDVTNGGSGDEEEGSTNLGDAVEQIISNKYKGE